MSKDFEEKKENFFYEMFELLINLFSEKWMIAKLRESHFSMEEIEKFGFFIEDIEEVFKNPDLDDYV